TFAADDARIRTRIRIDQIGSDIDRAEIFRQRPSGVGFDDFLRRWFQFGHEHPGETGIVAAAKLSRKQISRSVAPPAPAAAVPRSRPARGRTAALPRESMRGLRAVLSPVAPRCDRRLSIRAG